MSHRMWLGTFVVAFMTSGPCVADLRPYVFVDGGIADPDLNGIEAHYERMKDEASNAGGNGKIDTDDTSGAFAIGVGIQPYRHFAMEVGYYDFGSYDIEGAGQYLRGERQMSASGDTRTTIDGWGAQGIFIMPLSERFTVQLGAGAAWLDTRIEGQYTQSATTRAGTQTRQNDIDKTMHDTVALLGLGARYRITSSVQLRVDYRYFGGVGQYTDEHGSEVQLVTAGVSYHF
ncbi:outer membrane protein [Halomonas organivorans]|uniref:Opacity protein-like surface antigen n=1 Tax=Halomonas organivorans TaxID=257772 RepID=A0A7W5C123_9GAMM|nr:outer membrane beta-barrel protein [Halomonas organivorans]MBB3142636.1 opacity protein-like surface antigen [Halomonas organivorans]